MTNNATIALVVVAIIIVLGGVLIFMNQPDVSLQETREADVMHEDNVDSEELIDETIVLPPVTPVVVSPTPSVSTAVVVKEFTVRGSNFKFTPSEIRVKQGDTVRVTFINESGTHDWNLDEFNVKTKLVQAGQQETVEFVASKIGQFEYYCSVGQHRQMGMKGLLIVE